MAYKVVKKIKGNLYLYLQSTFRVNGKVKTQSTYLYPLGTAGGGGGNLSKTDTSTGEHSTARPAENSFERSQPKETNGTAGSASGQSAEAAPKATKQTQKTQNSQPSPKKVATTKLKIKINLKTQDISERNLLSTYEKQISLLQSLGINTASLGKIKLKYSSINDEAPKHKKVFLSSDYNVYIPMLSKGQRTKFLREYRRAVAKLGLDLIKKEDTHLYSSIKSQFNNSYKNTNHILTNYILNTSDKSKGVKAFIINYFGMYKPSGQADALNIGATDEKRESWVDEYAHITGDILNKGYISIHDECDTRLQLAINNEKRAATARFKRESKKKWYNHLQVGYMEKANQNLRRAMARVEAQKEMLEKIKMIGKIYNLE